VQQHVKNVATYLNSDPFPRAWRNNASKLGSGSAYTPGVTVMCARQLRWHTAQATRPLLHREPVLADRPGI